MLTTQIAIVGAGPYGLSIAAHLRAKGVSLRIFGTPMETWRQNMPNGMLLKSDGFASNLSDPNSSLTLERFCNSQGIAYHDTRVPVALETFTKYGLDFQRRAVPELEDVKVTGISRQAGKFHIRLDSGEVLTAEKVVMAVGISHFAFVPPEFQHLPSDFLTHGAVHRSANAFQGRKVIVIGAGASAVDIAAMLHESAVDVEVIARHRIRFHDPPSAGPRPLWMRLRHPSTGIGPGLRSRFYTGAPTLFHRLPEHLRLHVVRTHLGPAPGWAVKEKVVGRVPFLEGYSVRTAEVRNDRVRLNLKGVNGEECIREASHVIVATGYRVDLSRLAFLDSGILSGLSSVEGSPILSVNFESSVSGLFFVGLAAANSFGPLLRFAYGSEFAARRIAAFLTRSVSRAA
jgi:hypothetical protein